MKILTSSLEIRLVPLFSTTEGSESALVVGTNTFGTSRFSFFPIVEKIPFDLLIFFFFSAIAILSRRMAGCERPVND